jgi:hypothetical protein
VGLCPEEASASPAAETAATATPTTSANLVSPSGSFAPSRKAVVSCDHGVERDYVDSRETTVADWRRPATCPDFPGGHNIATSSTLEGRAYFVSL